MIKAIPMEDWLRGCVYHDGRHGEVTLPTDKVLEIANYIQLTRTSQTDGCIELPPYTADTPQTDCDKCIWSVCNYNRVDWDADTPQAESYYKKEDVVRVVENVKRGYGLTKSAEDIVSEMQTDCGWK